MKAAKKTKTNKRQRKEKTIRKGAVDLRMHFLHFPELHHNLHHSINHVSSQSVLLWVFRRIRFK